MATKKPLKTAGKKKQPNAVETSASIESQIEQFLKSGGKIEQVNSGVSGQPSMVAPKAAPAPKAAAETPKSEPAAKEPSEKKPA